MLDENHHLIQCILDHQSKGKTAECAQYQQILHRNLVYLATIADSNQNMQSLLPAPPTQNMNLGPGALSQSGSSQGLHSQGSLSDAIGTGLPASSLLQGQIGNGPNHVSMQQTAQSTLPTTSMSMSGSGHGTGPGYSHSGPASQSVPLQGQGAIGNYVSRANINMQSNPVSMMHQQAASSHYNSAQGGSQHYQGQSSIAMMGQSGQGSSMMGQRPMAPYRPSQQGSSQQYLGQEEYYGEQYGHGQAAAEPMGQQYYPDGHGDYAYQQSSYTEQSYDRSFEESTQHYYESAERVKIRVWLWPAFELLGLSLPHREVSHRGASTRGHVGLLHQPRSPPPPGPLGSLLHQRSSAPTSSAVSARVLAGKMAPGLARDVLSAICSLKCMFLDPCFGLRILAFHS
ncbi:calcium-responsive transactivator isoform X1 [Equus quagga]|nr:calcium-responsive transactivator isoform X1 [Equus quagga]XP_046535189.1 calcium-responsive transactivator isoform X1 [Equus quagga]XP_046535190.1 calcium-responsive transactivator isoform X1 [Equus quagga]